MKQVYIVNGCVGYGAKTRYYQRKATFDNAWPGIVRDFKRKLIYDPSAQLLVYHATEDKPLQLIREYPVQ